jgi:hypothetical protein
VTSVVLILVFVSVREFVMATDISDCVVKERSEIALFATLSKIMDRKRHLESRNRTVINSFCTHIQTHGGLECG